MPNWCEGTLKVRGKMIDVAKWVKENVVAYSYEWKKNENGVLYQDTKPLVDNVVVKYDEFESEEIYVVVKSLAHISGTTRNFVLEGTYSAIERADETTILTLNFKAAWGIQSMPYVAMSQKYSVDFRLYGFERGMEYNQEVIVENGRLIQDMDIKFGDYEWECIYPQLGG